MIWHKWAVSSDVPWIRPFLPPNSLYWCCSHYYPKPNVTFPHFKHNTLLWARREGTQLDNMLRHVQDLPRSRWWSTYLADCLLSTSMCLSYYWLPLVISCGLKSLDRLEENGPNVPKIEARKKHNLEVLKENQLYVKTRLWETWWGMCWY